jgi:carbon storage regulator CsrA
MLVLTRKVGDKVQLGDDVEIEVLSIRGNRVRLGIVAPSDVKILRGELPRHDAEAREATEPLKSVA